MELKFGTQAEVEATIRSLAADLETKDAKISDLTEANRRVNEALEAASQRGDAAPVAKYLDKSGKVILCGFDVMPDGSRAHDHGEATKAQPVAHVHGYLDDPKPADDLQKEIQRAVDTRNLVRIIQLGLHGRDPGFRPQTPILDAEIGRLAEHAPEPVRRAFSDSTNAGAEWIPTDTLPEVGRAMEQLYVRRVPGLFPETQVARDITLPTFLYGFTPYMHAVTGDDPARYTSSSVYTSSTSTTLKTIAARTQVGEDAAEEAIVPVAQMLREAMAYALVSVEEDAILNGDTTASHADTGIATWNPNTFWAAAPGGGATDHRRAWIGLRHQAGDVSNTVDRSTFSAATLLLDIAQVAGGEEPNAVKLITSLKCGMKNFSGITQVLSIADFGPGSMMTGGYLSRIAGMDVIYSRFMSDELNASGIFDDSTKTYGAMALVNAAAWRRWTRYGLRVAMELDATRGIWNLCAKRRMDFRANVATDKSVRYCYKMAVS